MRTFLYGLLVCLLFLNGSRCSYQPSTPETGFGPSKLKPEWTKNTRVFYSYSGGMIDESQNINIYTDSVIYIVRGDQMENKYKFVFSKDELNAIAKVFSDNKFDKIEEVQTGTVYDKGSHAIGICNDADCIQKAESANSTFTGDNAKRLRVVTDYVLKSIKEKFSALLVDVPVNINKNILNSAYELQFQTAPGRTIFTTSTSGKVERDMIQLAPGVYRISATTFTGSPNTGYKYKQSASIMFDTYKHKELAFAFDKDSSLIISTFNK